jgi:hypothetical protein
MLKANLVGIGIAAVIGCVAFALSGFGQQNYSLLSWRAGGHCINGALTGATIYFSIQVARARGVGGEAIVAGIGHAILSVISETYVEYVESGVENRPMDAGAIGRAAAEGFAAGTASIAFGGEDEMLQAVIAGGVQFVTTLLDEISRGTPILKAFTKAGVHFATHFLMAMLVHRALPHTHGVNELTAAGIKAFFEAPIIGIIDGMVTSVLRRFM